MLDKACLQWDIANISECFQTHCLAVALTSIQSLLLQASQFPKVTLYLHSFLVRQVANTSTSDSCPQNMGPLATKSNNYGYLWYSRMLQGSFGPFGNSSCPQRRSLWVRALASHESVWRNITLDVNISPTEIICISPVLGTWSWESLVFCVVLVVETCVYTSFAVLHNSTSLQ